MNSIYILSGLGILSLLSEILNLRKILFPLAVIGLLASAAFVIVDWNTSISYFSDMVAFDNFAVAFSAIISIVALLWLLLANDYLNKSSQITDHFALVMFSLIGAVFMVSYSNMAMLFLGIEILSISLYVLAGSRTKDLSSNEASFKYFLMGSFATGFLLFGIALIYGVTGSFNLQEIASFISSNNSAPTSILFVGILMMLIGLAFKVSAAPFHFWAPDVYEGSPTIVTAFMSTIVKIAAFGAFFKLFSTCFATVLGQWGDVMQFLAILTLIVGNVTAVYQNSVKRILAFSSIAHAGYMLITLVTLNDASASAILYYVASYAVASLSAFAVLYNVSGNTENISVDAFNGLAKKNPFLAFSMTVSLLSLAGIPPLAGFFAKYYIFTVAIQSNYVGLVILAVITSLIGVYYYFRILIAMYLKPLEGSAEPIKVPSISILLLALTIVLSVVLGIAPDFFINLI